MALMTDEQRAELRTEIARQWSAEWKPLGLSKSELRDAVNETDIWINANASAFNLALPLAARNALSAADKARLFMWVAEKRYVEGA